MCGGSGSSGTIIARSNSFDIECAWYRVRLTLKKDVPAPETYDLVKKEVERTTGIPIKFIDIVEIEQKSGKPVVLVFDLKGGAPPAELSSDDDDDKLYVASKCPISGLSGLLNYPNVDPESPPTADRIDFSDPDPNINGTNTTTSDRDNFYGGVVQYIWWMVTMFVCVILIIVFVVFVLLHHTKKKKKDAVATYRESQRIKQDWREARTKSNRVYYYNAVTNESSWDPPSTTNAFFGMGNGGGDSDVNEEVRKSLLEAESELPPGWHATIDQETERVFWYHDDAETTTWGKPDWVPKGWIPTEDQWEEFTTAETGVKYYYNTKTGTTQWEPPSGRSNEPRKSGGMEGTDRAARRQRIMEQKREGGDNGMRGNRANTHERDWSKARRQQDFRRKEDGGTTAVGIQLTEL